MKTAINFIYIIAGILISPVVLYRMARHKRYRKGWSERLGKIRRKYPKKACIWIHAVSVGEVNATKTLIAGLRDRFPGFEIVLSTTTDTGFARANSLYGDKMMVFYFPFDFSFTMERAFENIQPAICLLMELEVWPNFVRTAADKNIPVVLVNGRITKQSSSKYKLIKPLAKKMFAELTLLLTQSEEYSRRFEEIGCDREKIMVTSSLKYDTAQVTDKVQGSDALAEELKLTNERLWVAGGTGNGEEKIILDVFSKLKKAIDFANVRLVIVPRKPERFDEVAKLIEKTQFKLVRYSTIKQGTCTTGIDKASVILGDTMGDLRKFYSLADIVFVGRSLVPMGGSDMMEAAALSKCTIFGPYTYNFNQTVGVLLGSNAAIRVKNSEELLIMLKKCLREPQYAERLGQNGRRTIIRNQGATAASVEQIGKILAET